MMAKHTDLNARQIAEAAMEITAELCIYTNDEFVFEELSEDNEGTDST
jgi:ATP-dependent HslUV protease subunit HslV